MHHTRDPALAIAAARGRPARDRGALEGERRVAGVGALTGSTWVASPRAAPARIVRIRRRMCRASRQECPVHRPRTVDTLKFPLPSIPRAMGAIAGREAALELQQVMDVMAQSPGE